MNILQNRFLNKGTSFTQKEREAFKITGLLPPRVLSLDVQERRALELFRSKSSNLEKYIFLSFLQNTQEDLFFSLVMNNLQEVMPIIYTPTVGEACLNFSFIFTQPRGLFISIMEKGKIGKILESSGTKEVKVIVVTDGERILGLGDLGVNGMGIPIGKLALYTACAGIRPDQCLPVTLDVGTNNEGLKKDPFYLGLQVSRVRGKEYDEFLEEFLTECTKAFPGVLIQFEDFGNENAFKLLEHYRSKICCFNDDIQGTASVAFSGILSALKITKGRLRDQRILFLGAGEAALGIANLVVFALAKEGLTEEESRKRCWFVDSRGLVESSRTNLSHHKKPFAHKFKPIKDLASAIKELKPTALIGVSGQGRQFTKEIVQDMAAFNELPMIFALSNPTSKAECTAEEAYSWTNGRAIFSSGSPFAPITLPSGKTLTPGQGNNAYVFPGIGLGVLCCGALTVDQEMFYVAAKTLSELVSDDTLAGGCIYPPLNQIRDVSFHIAVKICEYAHEKKLATLPFPGNLGAHVRAQMYDPRIFPRSHL